MRPLSPPHAPSPAPAPSRAAAIRYNEIVIWKYPSLVKVAELRGHTRRVLHMAASPDGTTIVTAAADETLRFWKVLSGPRAKDDAARANESVLGWTSIR